MKKRIWHKQDEIPELGRCVLIIQCFGKNDTSVVDKANRKIINQIV